MKILSFCLLLLAVCARAAVPTLESFDPTKFVTNGNRVAYSEVLTNEVGVIHPAVVNTDSTWTNQSIYGVWSTPSKVTLLTLGTNQLDMTQQSAWLLNSPTNDATQVILSLSSGKYQGQHAFLLSQNGAESFTLPNLSEQYDVPGALVIIGSDWIGSTNRGIHLVYSAPDWVIEGVPTDPSVPGGGATNFFSINGTTGAFTTGAGVTNISTVLSGNYTAGSNITLTTNANGAVEIASTGGGGSQVFTNVSGVIQPAPGQTTNTLQFISGAADNATNVALVVDTAAAWTQGHLQNWNNGGTNVAFMDAFGAHIRRSDNFTNNGTFSFLDLVDEAVDSNPNADIYLQVDQDQSNPNSTRTGVSYLHTDSAGSFLDMLARDPSTNIVAEILLNCYGGPTFSISGTGGVGQSTLLYFSPEAASGSATPYFSGTSQVMTNGDLLWDFQNTTISRTKIQHDGSISLSGQTNRLGDDGTRLQFNGSPLVTFVYPIACSDETTAITAGTAKVTFRMPFACTLTSVRASLTTAQASGSIFTVDINESGTTILSTKLTIDNTETTSTTAATPPVISDSSIADDAIITVDVDQIGNGTGTGLKIILYGYQ
jgi:hypothetical protein